ncbi:MAG: A24 family peptidase C-terminal domain-containing protein [Thermoplasmata archaeon]
MTDRLWQVLGILGIALGAAALAPEGFVGVALWLLVGGFALQHMFPWDDVFGESSERLADLVEGAIYGVVSVIVLVAAGRLGVGATGVPIPVLALFLTVLFARGLFEVGVLYGGADAKALMIAGLLVPIFATPAVGQSPELSRLLTVLPFSVNVLMDAALLSIVIPIGIALRNLARREFRFPASFSGYTIPVRELPQRFVWLKDPLSSEGKAEPVAETSEEDRLQRVRAARELESRGVERVWVTPQIPFLVLMAAGALLALLTGNLVLDIVSRV